MLDLQIVDQLGVGGKSFGVQAGRSVIKFLDLAPLG